MNARKFFRRCRRDSRKVEHSWQVERRKKIEKSALKMELREAKLEEAQQQEALRVKIPQIEEIDFDFYDDWEARATDYLMLIYGEC